jgi:non-ribosomal peptide synthase protein (TIGR01720 family)
MQLVGEAEKQGLFFTVQEVFEYPTIAQLADKVKKITAINTEQAIEPTENKLPFPLTPIQHWFFEQNFSQPEQFSQVCLIRINVGQEKVQNKEKLKIALKNCVENYSIFRLRFKKLGNHWQQYYNEQPSCITWNEQLLAKGVDFSEYISTQQLYLQQPFNLEAGPLFGIQLITREENPSSIYLLMVIHHLIIDGVSWRILLQNLERVYNLDCDIRLTLSSFANVNSFQLWSWALQQHLPALPPNKLYEMNSDAMSTFNIPLDYQKGPNLVKTNQKISQTLNNEATCLLLQQLHTHYAFYPHELLIALLVKLLAEWTENSNILLDLESHGRQEIAHNLQINNALGWFTSLYPVYFKAPQTKVLIDSIESIVTQLHNIPNGGIDYGINRYLNPSDTKLLPYSSVNFNYWGQFSQLFSTNNLFSFEELSLSSHPENSRIYLLTIEARVNNGQLQIDWNYSENYHRKKTIQRLVTRYFEQLEAFLKTIPNKVAKVAKSQVALSLAKKQVTTPGLPDKINRLNSTPLSPMQKGLYFYGTANPHSEAYMVQLIWELKPNINNAILHNAFKKLVERYTILRTYFQLEGTEPQQRVKSEVELPWQIYDWRGYSEEKITSLLQNDRKKGFNFEQAPLLRVALISEDYCEKAKQENTVGERRKILITFHHILMDGWCLSPLLQELGQYYQALEQNALINLPTPIPYQYYIDWLHKQDLNAAKRYWQAYFHDLQSPTTTCSLIQSPNEKNLFVLPDCRSETYSLSIELTLEIQQFLQSNGLTLNSFMQGLWGLLLHCYTGNPEILSGATFSDRLAQKQTQPIMGLLINTLPLYLNFTDNINSIDYFQKVQRQLSDMMRYSYTPLADIRTYSRYPSDKSLFETLVITENYPEVPLTGLGINFNDIEIIDPTHYPLTILIIPNYPLRIKINYNANHISTENVQRLFAHLKQLCSEVINKTEQPVQQLNYLPPAEQQLILQWSQGDNVYPPYQTVVDYFEQELQTTKRDHTIAAIDGQEKVTYGTLNNKANQLAHHLIQSGVKPGDFIGIYVERGLDMLVGILATLKTGAAYVPLDPGYPEQRLQYMLQDCDSQFVLTQKQLTEKLTRLIASLTNVKTVVIEDNTLFRGQPTTNISLAREANTPMYLVYTSGSTGKPKPIQQAHQTMVNLIHWQTKTQTSREKLNTISKSAQFSNFGFDVCVQEIFFSLLNGLTLYIIPETLKKSPDKLVQFILDKQINQLFLPTAFLNIFCQTAIQCNDCPEKWYHLQHIIVAGEKLKLNNTSLDFFKQYQHIRLHNHYGPSETHVVTTYTLDNTLSTWPATPSIGKPIDNTGRVEK